MTYNNDRRWCAGVDVVRALSTQASPQSFGRHSVGRLIDDEDLWHREAPQPLPYLHTHHLR